MFSPKNTRRRQGCVKSLLSETLDEEMNAAEKLMDIGKDTVFELAVGDDTEEE